MANRTAFPGTATNTTHLASEDNSLPGGWIGFAEVTADQGSITTLTDLTGLSQAVTVNTTRKIRITFYHPRTASTVTNDRFRYHIREGSTTLQSMDSSVEATSQGVEGGPMVWIGNPSSGSHTYKVSLERIGGTGTLTMIAASTWPAQLLIEDIGPAS